MAYGTVELTSADIEFLKNQNDAAKAKISANLAASSSDEERAFYVVAAQSVANMAIHLNDWQPGKHSFDEATLLLLRGLAAPSNPTEFATRLQAARKAQDTSEEARVEAEWNLSNSLRAKLEKPFLDDHSQDAEAEEDEVSDE